MEQKLWWNICLDKRPQAVNLHSRGTAAGHEDNDLYPNGEGTSMEHYDSKTKDDGSSAGKH